MKYKRVYDGTTLIGYISEKGFIEIHYFDITPSGNFHKDYYANGFRFSRLADAKAEIENTNAE